MRKVSKALEIMSCSMQKIRAQAVMVTLEPNL